MLHTIQFRGRTLSFNVERGFNTNFISEYFGVENKKFCYIKHESNSNTETLSVDYLQLIEVEGKVVDNSTARKPKINNTDSFAKFYEMTDLSGDSTTKASLNFISETEIDNQCIAFNPLKSFNAIQPVTFDFITSETGVTVTVIDEPIDSVLLYLIGDPTDPMAIWQILPSTEIPLNSGAYPFFVINQADGYPFGSTDAFTISEEVVYDTV